MVVSAQTRAPLVVGWSLRAELCAPPERRATRVLSGVLKKLKKKSRRAHRPYIVPSNSISASALNSAHDAAGCGPLSKNFRPNSPLKRKAQELTHTHRTMHRTTTTRDTAWDTAGATGHGPCVGMGPKPGNRNGENRKRGTRNSGVVGPCWLLAAGDMAGNSRLIVASAVDINCETAEVPYPNPHNSQPRLSVSTFQTTPSNISKPLQTQTPTADVLFQLLEASRTGRSCSLVFFIFTHAPSITGPPPHSHPAPAAPASSKCLFQFRAAIISSIGSRLRFAFVRALPK